MSELQEVFEFFAERAADEEDGRSYDLPNHAPTMIVSEAEGVLSAAEHARVTDQVAEQTDREPIPDEEKQEMLEDAVVDLLSAIGALKYEEDLDIADAVERRREFIADYDAFEEAMEDAETQDEQIEAMDEHLTEELARELGIEMDPDQLGAPEAGDNVDDEDYEHDNVDHNFH